MRLARACSFGAIITERCVEDDVRYTANDFPATPLLGIDSAATDLQRRALFRRAHDLAVIAHADYAESGAGQDRAVLVLHAFEAAFAGQV